MKKLVVLFSALLWLSSAHAAFLELNNAQEFEQLVKTSKVPVVVQFSAYWCGPCQHLKATFKTVAKDYSDEKVRIAYVDAYENSSLGKYLQGGYPTVRVFVNGQLTEQGFVGAQPESEVRAFLDSVVSGHYDDESGDEPFTAAMY